MRERDDVKKGRVFTEEERKEMEGRTLDHLVEAIEGGDKEKAKKLANRMYKEFLSMHDGYLNQITGYMDWIYRHEGDDALFEAHRMAMKPGMDELLSGYEKADFRRKVQMMAAGLRGHLQPITVEEDDEKVSIKMHPCGSGQRLFESGAYEPTGPLKVIDKPHCLTYGMDDYPIYCTHAPIMELFSMERVGYPMFFTVPADKMARESCSYCLYKDPEKIPEEVYERVGKQKPKKKR